MLGDATVHFGKLWIGRRTSNQRPVLRSHDQCGPIIGPYWCQRCPPACVYIVQWLQGPDTTVKLPQKGQPNAIPKISMLSLLSITAQLSFHASVTDHFYHLSKIISQFIPVDWTPPTGVLARVTQRAYRPSLLVLGQWHLNTIVNFCELWEAIIRLNVIN